MGYLSRIEGIASRTTRRADVAAILNPKSIAPLWRSLFVMCVVVNMSELLIGESGTFPLYEALG